MIAVETAVGGSSHERMIVAFIVARMTDLLCSVACPEHGGGGRIVVWGAGLLDLEWRAGGGLCCNRLLDAIRDALRGH
jgi:hypothetical protein